MTEPIGPSCPKPAIRWGWALALLALFVLLCGFVYRLRAVFTPLLVGAAIAYILNPAVTWLERARRVPRLASVIVAFALLAAVVVTGGLYVSGRAAAQLDELRRQMPAYVQRVDQWVDFARSRIGLPEPSSAAPATVPSEEPETASSDWWSWAGPAVKEHGVSAAQAGMNVLRGAASSLASLVGLLVLVPVFTFYFLWRFNDGVALLRDHLPAAYRDRIVYLVRTTDAAVAAFFRGRLIVCLIIGVLTSLGWSLVGVPYSLPLGLLVGLLNLVPFLSLLALPPALLFTFLRASDAGQPWFWPVVLAMGVYMAVQALESFVLGPVILGRTVGLHPLLTVVVLLIGGELGGLLGLLLAIPIASTLRTLGAELLVPELRRLAGTQPAVRPGPGGSGTHGTTG